MKQIVTGLYQTLRSADSEIPDEDLTVRLRAKLSLARQYLRSDQQVRLHPDFFQDVHTYCLFLGHARSGGSLAGALLDAHPDAIIADEVEVFQYLCAGFSREQIFHILMTRSHQQAEKGHTKPGQDRKDYSYAVPGQWQGRNDSIQVVGNRKAGMTTQRIGRDPALLDQLQDVLDGIQLKLVVVLRNPFDTISTMNIRSGRELTNGLQQYFSNCETIQDIQTRIPAERQYVVRHEVLLADPQASLVQLCRFLNLKEDEAYLRACTEILFKKPATSRQKVNWKEEDVNFVKQKIDKYAFLHGYSYES
jgi:hypothetical protein